jgi:hypothetical protein
MTINHWSLPISANVPIYLTNSLQIFAPFNGHRKRRRLAPWRDTWRPVIGDVLEDGMGETIELNG